MDDMTKGKLIEAGADLKSAKERFMGNEELYLRFIKKFSGLPDYEKLDSAMRYGRCSDAFEAAHALKGVCGNLSLTGLFDKLSVIVELLRSGDIEAALELYPEFNDDFCRVSAILLTIE